MNVMTKKERVMAAIRCEEVDKIPYSIWYHLPEYDQDPVALAEEQIRLAELYNLDFIKMMPFGNYVAQDYGLSVSFYCQKDKPAFEREFGIHTPEDWLKIEPLPAIYGTYGKQLQLTQQTAKHLKEDIPFVQTIFSPLTVAKKLAGPRIFEDIKEKPEYVHSALKAITQTTINFVKANIEAGISGFFLATQCASSDFMTWEEYDVFGKPYDLEVLKSYQDVTYFNILHIHGDNTYFEKLADYPVHCINWHDRWAKPSLEEARKITNKCLMGGINEKWLETAPYEAVTAHIEEAVSKAGRKGLMITPGCCIELGTPDVNLLATSVAAASM